ncbi:hypothetical protein PHYPSEUDO_006359 [Phytophthora pseudosyringae]|uniref:RxLR effector protein n=1 Tax=Phytophthora pseudosyringae TaxID=221518 RepID=A0A8T1WCB0_9STRA|nr:hypothetical protein PHYPSEUDO_006359 [Phytophthora pseudosyringae]
MKATLILTLLTCVVLAMAPTYAEHQLRAEGSTTPTPLDAFKAEIAKFEKKPASRELRSDENGKEVVKKFVDAIEELKKNGRARRMEEDGTDYHVDSLVGQVNGRNY